jgi:hypothetical protein
MSVFSNQSIYQFIGNADSGLVNTGIATSTQTGQFTVLVDEANNVVSTTLASSTAKVRLATRRTDGTYRFSPWFTYSDIIPSSKQYLAYARPQEQVSYVGANAAGTIAGLGTVTAGNTYELNVTLLHSMADTNNTPLIRLIPYMAVSGDTQQSVATGLMNAGLRIFNTRGGVAENCITLDRFASGATNTGAALATANLFKFTNGSKTVTAYLKDTAADVAMTASTTSVTAAGFITVPSSNGRTFTFTAITSVGHAIYLGSQSIYVASAGNADANCAAIVAAINAATTGIGSICVASGSTSVTITMNKDVVVLPPVVLSDPAGTVGIVAVTTSVGEAKSVKYVYDATTSAAATFNLDIPWQGATGYCTTATIDSAAKFTYLCGTYTIGTTPLWGIKLTGKALSFNAITGKFQKVRFSVTPVGWANAPINPYTGTQFTTLLGFDAVVTYGDAQTALEGSGNYEQVAEMEILTQFQNKGNQNLQAYPPTQYIQTASTTTTYGILSWVVKNTINDTPGVQPYTYTTYNVAMNSTLFDSAEDGHDIAEALVISI